MHTHTEICGMIWACATTIYNPCFHPSHPKPLATRLVPDLPALQTEDVGRRLPRGKRTQQLPRRGRSFVGRRTGQTGDVFGWFIGTTELKSIRLKPNLVSYQNKGFHWGATEHTNRTCICLFLGCSLFILFICLFIYLPIYLFYFSQL